MTQSRPNYVLKLADGTERVFEPHFTNDAMWCYEERSYYKSELEKLGATPVPQEEPNA